MSWDVLSFAEEDLSSGRDLELSELEQDVTPPPHIRSSNANRGAVLCQSVDVDAGVGVKGPHVLMDVIPNAFIDHA